MKTRRLAGLLLSSVVLVFVAVAALFGVSPNAMSPAAFVVGGEGYWLVAADGGIFDFGDAEFSGSTGATKLNSPIVGMAPDLDGEGYWLVAADGGIFAFDAEFHGSMGGSRLNSPIVGMAADPDGEGYWLVAADGGIFAFDAGFHGSTGHFRLNQPIVGMAADPDGEGYWMIARDGGIFAFDAGFYESMGGSRLNQPIVGMAATVTGEGYWLVARDGGIFSFGDAEFRGSTGDIRLNSPIVGMAADPDGDGYWMVAGDGGIFAFAAEFYDSMGGGTLNSPIVGMASTPMVELPNEAPLLKLTTGPVNGAKVNDATPTYGGTASDVDGTVDAIAAKIDGGPFSTAGVTCTGCGTQKVSWSFTAPSTLGNGTHTVSFAAVDSDGGVSPVLSRSVVVDTVRPSVTVNQAPGQEDPSDEATVDFVAQFSEAVTGFTTGDVTLSGTAGATTATVTAVDGDTYNVAVTGMTADGTVVAAVAADKAVDAAGNGNTASTTTDNQVTRDTEAPAFDSITVGGGSTTVVASFSEPLRCSSVADGDFTATVNAGSVPVTDVVCDGTGDAAVLVRLASAPDGGNTVAVTLTGVVNDLAGNAAATPRTRSAVASNQAPVLAVTGGPASGSSVNDTTPTYTGTVTDDGTVAAVEVSIDGGAFSTDGVTGTTSWSFTPTAALDEGAHTIEFQAVDNADAVSSPVTRTVTVDVTPPEVTIAAAAGQEDPTDEATVDFVVQFGEPVAGFATGDVSLSGAAGATTATVTAVDGDTYNVAVTGMTGPGSVIASVGADKASDAAGNGNVASAEPATVTYDPTPPTVDTLAKSADQSDPTNEAEVDFRAVFSEDVVGFETGDVTVSGSAGATTATVTAVDARTYDIAVTGMTTSGAVTVAIEAGKATDVAGNANSASGSATVQFDSVVPTIETVVLTTTDGAGNASWDAVGDELTITWSEAVSHTAGNSSLTKTQVEGILGTTVGYATLPASTVTLAGSGTTTWTLTVGGAALSDDVAENDATDGTANADVTDAAGNAQAPATGVVMDVGPRVVQTRLTTSDSATNHTWDAVGDVLTVTWNEAATHADADDVLDENQVAELLGAVVEFGGATTATLADNGTTTWTLTVADEALTDGITVSEETSGDHNDDVTDGNGNRQVPSAGVTLGDGVGPSVAAAVLSSDDGNGIWDKVGDVLRVSWNEDGVVHVGNPSTLTEAQVEAVLGTALAYGATPSVVSLSVDEPEGGGNDTWALTIGGGNLSEGVASSDSVNGTANTAVTDGLGNPQQPATGITVGDPLRIVATRMTQTNGASTTEWNDVGEVLTIKWSRAATHAGNASTLTEAQLRAVLDTSITLGALSSLTLAGNGTDTWTVTIASAALTDGVVGGDTTLGTNNGNVEDPSGLTQVRTSGVTFGIGPRVSKVTVTDGNGAGGWNSAGDVLTVTWTEAAQHSDTDGSLDEAQVNNMLGSGVVSFGDGASVTLAGNGTATWTLTVANAALTDGVVDGEAVNGTNNAQVTDLAGNPQLVTTGRTVGVGPYVTAVRLTKTDGAGNAAWDAVADEATVTWSEAAFRIGTGAVSEAEIEAMLGTDIALPGGTPLPSFTITGSGTSTWTIAIGDAALAEGVSEDDATKGTANTGVADAATGGNPQLPGGAVTFGVGPRITAASITDTDGASNTTWNAVGDALTVAWNEAAHRIATGAVTEAEVEAILGTTIALPGGTPQPTFTISGDGTDAWTITIGAAALAEGVDAGDLVVGTNNTGVADAATSGSPQVPTTGITVGVGPAITAVQLVEGDGADGWNTVGDVVEVTWNKAAYRVGGDTDALSEADLENLFDTTVAYASTGGTSTVALTGSGTATWTLTVGGADLAEGIADGDAVNGRANAGVTDAAEGGNPQVRGNGVTLGVGPRLTAVRLVSDDGTDGWAAAGDGGGAGDVLQLTWSEAAFRAGGNGSVAEADVEAILGRALQYGAGTVVTLAGHGTNSWTLTISGASLTTGVADGDVVNGSANSSVRDASTGGNPQVASTGVRLSVGPRIASTSLTATDGGATTNTKWDAVGDKLTVNWTEAADYTESVVDEGAVNAILGTAVEFATAPASTVALTGDGTATWTLTIGGAALTTGVTEGDATNGTVYDKVVDSLGNRELPTTGMTFGVGPRATKVALTTTDASTPSAWDAIGDVLTITWNEAAYRAGGDGSLLVGEVNAILGTGTVTYDTGSTVTLAGHGTNTWTLTVGGKALTDGIGVGESVPGTNNSAVTDAASGGNPQVPVAARVAVDAAAPYLVAARISASGDATPGTWAAVGDELTLTWNETVVAPGGATLTAAQLAAVLGTAVAYSDGTTVSLAADGSTWRLTVAGAALTDGVTQGEAVPGSANGHAEDAAGNDQVAASGVTLQVGPWITAVRLTNTDATQNTSWNADGDELVIEWSEDATRAGTGPVTKAEVEALLGTTVTFPGTGTSPTFDLDTSDADRWKLTVDDADLASGVAEGAATAGTDDNDGVTDGSGNAQVRKIGVVLGVGPRFDAVRLTTTDSTTPTVWDRVGDVITVEWNEAATHAAGNGVVSEAVVEAILDTDIEPAPSSTVTLAESGSDMWTLTIGGAALVDGVTLGDATTGRNNAAVTDAAGNPAVPTAGRVLADAAPPVILATRLTEGVVTGSNDSWKESGEQLTIAWSEAVSRTTTGALTSAELTSILGATVDLGTATVSLTGDGTATWTLTIGGASLATGVADGTATNGTGSAATPSALVQDAAENGAVATTGVQFGVGPRISAARLTGSVDGDNVWDAVGEVLTVTWNEAATHADADGSLTTDEVDAVLGTSLAGTTTATLGGSGSATWTLTLAGSDLATGLSEGAAVAGTNNPDVDDAADNPQVPVAGVTLGVGPQVQSVQLTTSADGDRTFDAIGEVARVTWSEAASHVDADGTLSVAQLNAALGTSMTGTSTFAVTGLGSATWTLTVQGADLATGVADEAATNGTNNADVRDAAANPQVAATGEAFGVGPSISAVQLTTSTDGDGSWDAVGDVLTVTWNEAATHPVADNGTLTAAQVAAILGRSVTYDGSSEVTLYTDGGSATWTLTIATEALAAGIADGQSVNGTNHAAVLDTAQNPQISTTGKTFGVGPRIVATRLGTDDGNATWDADGDVLTVEWSEEAWHAKEDNASLTAAEVNAILGSSVGYSTVPPTVTLTGSGSATWELTLDVTPLVSSVTDPVQENDPTNGMHNADVTDAENDGNPQLPATGVVFGVGPRIATATLTVDDGGDRWNAVGDRITITWNEVAHHADGDTDLLVEDAIEDVLGTELAYGTNTRIVLAGSGTTTWTLTIAVESLSEGVQTGDGVNGKNNTAVTDPEGNSQVPTTGVTLAAS